jgi:hypothetical protein
VVSAQAETKPAVIFSLLPNRTPSQPKLLHKLLFPSVIRLADGSTRTLCSTVPFAVTLCCILTTNDSGENTSDLLESALTFRLFLLLEKGSRDPLLHGSPLGVRFERVGSSSNPCHRLLQLCERVTCLRLLGGCNVSSNAARDTRGCDAGGPSSLVGGQQ